jgi:hypothetical protein
MRVVGPGAALDDALGSGVAVEGAAVGRSEGFADVDGAAEGVETMVVLCFGSLGITASVAASAAASVDAAGS